MVIYSFVTHNFFIDLEDENNTNTSICQHLITTYIYTMLFLPNFYMAHNFTYYVTVDKST